MLVLAPSTSLTLPSGRAKPLVRGEGDGTRRRRLPCRGVFQESGLLGCSGWPAYCWGETVPFGCREREVSFIVLLSSFSLRCSGDPSLCFVGDTRIFLKERDLVSVGVLPLESRLLRLLSGVWGGRRWPGGGDCTRSACRSSATLGGVCGAGDSCVSVRVLLPCNPWHSSRLQQQGVGLTRLCLR